MFYRAVRGGSIPGSTTDSTKWAVGLIARPLGYISAHVVETEFVCFSARHRPSATSVRHILPRSCGVVPIPCDLIQIIAPAVGESLSLRPAPSGPIPFGAAGESVAIGTWIDAGDKIPLFIDLTILGVDGLKPLHFAFRVTPFQSLKPTDALCGVVGHCARGRFLQVVSILFRKRAHGLPLAPGCLATAQGKRLHQCLFVQGTRW